MYCSDLWVSEILKWADEYQIGEIIKILDISWNHMEILLKCLKTFDTLKKINSAWS